MIDCHYAGRGIHSGRGWRSSRMLCQGCKLGRSSPPKSWTSSLWRSVTGREGGREGGRESTCLGAMCSILLQLSAIQQSESLLQHDKEYLSRQVGELAQKVSLAEGRLEGVGEELQTARQAKEDLFHQLVKCRYGGLDGWVKEVGLLNKPGSRKWGRDNELGGGGGEGGGMVCVGRSSEQQRCGYVPVR